MAQKRMFDRGIVSADSFTEMSSDAQSLYFHLGIHADDEGFVSPKGIMRMISAPEDSLKVLVSKNFVIPFKSGVVVITDWNDNNYLDSRRIRQTKYVEERKLLALTNDGKYELSGGLATAKQVLCQSSIEESRVEENRTTEETDDKKQADREIEEIIVSFKDVNPSYGKWFSNRTQRSSIKRMLKVHGKEKLMKVILFLVTSNTIPYLPTITSPYLLEEKWAALEAGLIKIKNKSVVNKPNVVFS